MFTVAKLDKSIYGCVSGTITTDDVVMTDAQIEHIKLRHPQDYDTYIDWLKVIIEDPDYIIEANKPNTAVVLKRLELNDKSVQLILRLAVEEDKNDYKNSVITFMEIGNKRFFRYLRTKQILYKKE